MDIGFCMSISGEVNLWNELDNGSKANECSSKVKLFFRKVFSYGEYVMGI